MLRTIKIVSHQDGDNSICQLPLIKPAPIIQCSHGKLWKHCIKTTDEDWQLSQHHESITLEEGKPTPCTTSQNWVTWLAGKQLHLVG